MAIINTFTIQGLLSVNEGDPQRFGIRTYKKDTETNTVSMNFEAVYTIDQINVLITKATEDYNDFVGLWNQIKEQAELIGAE